jgi:hypothetical protein
MANQLPPVLNNLGAGARNLADAALGADRVDRGLKGAARAGGALRAILKDLLSPLQIIAGFALTFSVGIYKAVMNSQLLQAALERAANVQVYSAQFDKLLGGLDKARQRVRELAREAARGPFKFEALVERDKTLRQTTNGRLDNPAAKGMANDLAAVAGISPAESAGLIGGLEDDVMNERSVAGTINQLRDLNGISAAAADELIMLERAGVRGAKMWGAITAALGRNKGATEALKNTLAGLTAQLEEVKGEQLGEIGKMFEQGKMMGLRAAISLIETFGPVLREALMPIALLANGLARLALGFGQLMKSIPGLQAVLIGLARAAGLVLAVLSAIAVVQLSRFFLLLVPLVLRLTGGLLGMAAAGGVASRALGLLGMGLLRFLGPIGLVLTALSLLGVNLDEVIAKFLGMDGAVGGASEAVRENAAAVQKQIAAVKAGGSSTATPQEKAEMVKLAEQGVKEAEERRKAAEEKLRQATTNREASDAQAAAANQVEAIRGSESSVAVAVALEATGLESVEALRAALDGSEDKTVAVALEATGLESVEALRAALDDVSEGEAAAANNEAATKRAGGRFGELNQAIRGFFGFDPAVVAEEDARAEVEKAKQEQEAAQQTAADARGLTTTLPSGFLNDPDAAAAQAEAAAKLAEADRKQKELEIGGLSPDAAAGMQAEIDALRSEAAGMMEPGAIEGRFNRRMASDEVQAKLSRTMADVTGDEQMRQQANTLEDNVRTERRAKELQNMGIERPQALQMATAETLTERLASERGRADNMTFASALGSVGGAAGEAGGGSSEEARILKEIKAIMERDGGPAKADLPATMVRQQR